MLDEVFLTILQSEAQLPAIQFSDNDPTSDDRLVELVLAGEETAFAEIFERYKRHVTLTVGRFFSDRAEVEEHVQQAFVKAYTSLNRYRGGEDNSFAAWLTRIAVNVCYDEFRRHKRRGQSLFTEMSRDETDYVETIVDGRERSTEQSLAARDLAERIMSGLDPMDRVAMTLVYSEDRSLDEVARSIGITTSNLKSRLFRCRNHIKKRFSHLF
ncbi:MAG TPA: sigma-70 family RNA polymerase sigma factor [Pyrinomonadaceae bacterium]|jgi:RNA polymerase sigma-70 factor (ECF subfamily)|nr:sigma-70 family RNA polymerase sigma factor [Pyrinomonadaceae bacterium]